MRHDDVQSIGCAALKYDDEALVARARVDGAKGGARGTSAGLRCGLSCDLSCGSGEVFFAGACICAMIESCVCFDTSSASSFASIAERINAASIGGSEVPASCAMSTFTPRTFPPV